MFELGLTSRGVDADSVVVGYSCPCGCTPAVTYERGAHAVTEGCCCGNEMVVGPGAAGRLPVKPGYELRSASVASPWREQLPVVWAIGPSTHPEPEDHAHDAPMVVIDAGSAIDPVCGMTVDMVVALWKDLHARYLETDYYFCGRGCKLDFVEGPGPYLAAGYVPSM